jgi:hypothetical protein
VEKRIRWLRAAAVVACLACAAPAVAAVVEASFGVSVMVVASCRIIPGLANPCARALGQAPTLVAEKPVVSFSTDPKSGAVIQTIEF